MIRGLAVGKGGFMSVVNRGSSDDGDRSMLGLENFGRK